MLEMAGLMLGFTLLLLGGMQIGFMGVKGRTEKHLQHARKMNNTRGRKIAS